MLDDMMSARSTPVPHPLPADGDDDMSSTVLELTAPWKKRGMALDGGFQVLPDLILRHQRGPGESRSILLRSQPRPKAGHPSPFRPMPFGNAGYAVPSTTKRSVTRIGRYETAATKRSLTPMLD